MKLQQFTPKFDSFDAWMLGIQKALPKIPTVFWSAAVDLRALYQSAVPDPEHHQCRCCHNTILNHGDTYWYDAQGDVQTFWSVGKHRAGEYAEVAKLMHEAVVSEVKDDNQLALIENVNIGHRQTGQFTHMLWQMPNMQQSHKVVHYREATERMNTALANGFNYQNLTKLRDLLNVAGSYRKSKIEPMLEFLITYVSSTARVKRKMLAQAHDGLTHPRASTIGSMIDDLMAGKNAQQIAKAFEAKVDPLAYQRAQAPARAGTVSTANRLFEEMGLESALYRREVRRDDIPESAFLWKPSGSANKASSTGAFDHLLPKPAVEHLADRRMTWARFEKELLPLASSIHWYGGPLRPFTLTTSLHSDAKPILRWDSEEQRNPVGWYFPSQAVSVSRGLYQIQAVLKCPEQWTGQVTSHEMRLLVTNERLRPENLTHSGLFAECTRHDLREVRSVMENYHTNSEYLTQGEKSDWSQGVGVTPVSEAIKLRVTTSVGIVDVVIDQYT